RFGARSSAARRPGWQRAARRRCAASKAAGPLRPLMRRVELADGADLAEWREAARALLLDAVPPEHVLWQSGAQDDLLGASLPRLLRDDLAQDGPGAPMSGMQAQAARDRATAGTRTPRVPREFLDLAALVIAHAD